MTRLNTSALSEESICGISIEVPSTSFIPKSISWSSSEILQGLKRENISLSNEALEQFRNVIWGDLCAEHDAENFCCLVERHGGDRSPEFIAFERSWRRDEFNHYLGFRSLYCMMYGVSEATVTQNLKEREVNFEPLKDFLKDEFLIALTIAYDEIATTRAYAVDHEMYRSLGNKAFETWIKNVTRDKGIHFCNCLEVVKRCHSKRINEIPEIVEELIKWNLQRNTYKASGLCNQHYAVEVAKDGQAGWELVQAFAYDLILLDVMLPKLDGISLCRRLRKQGYQMPILLLTGLHSSYDNDIPSL